MAYSDDVSAARHYKVLKRGREVHRALVVFGETASFIRLLHGKSQVT